MKWFNFFKQKTVDVKNVSDNPTYEQRIDKLKGRVFRLKAKLKEIRQAGNNSSDRYKNLERELIYNEELLRKLEK